MEPETNFNKKGIIFMIKIITGLVLIMAFNSFVFAGIIPPDRSIDWSNCGLPAKISPAANKADIKKDFGAKGDGVTDDSMAFIAAINSLTSGGVIIISSGTYLLKNPLVIFRDNIILRGVGKKAPELVFNFENDPPADALTFSGAEESGWTKVGAGMGKGSTKVEVEDASIFKTGDFAEIEEENDPSVHYTRLEWNQDWAQGIIGQVFKVTAIDGESIVIDEPLHISFTAKLEPRIRPMKFIKNSGIINIHLKRTDKGEGCMIALKKAAYCFVDRIESEYIMRSHVSMEQSYRCSVKGSYFHHAHDYGGGGHGYGVEIKRHSSNNLVEGNRFFHLRHSMMAHLGANGNVFGYNTSKEPFATADNDPNTMICDISVHGHYPYVNLFEGNNVQKIEISDYWGPCGPGNTFFKNIVESEGIMIKDGSNYQNIIGNKMAKNVNYDSSIDPATLIITGNHSAGEKQAAALDLPGSLYKKQK
jgi:hypothetical protein